MDGSHLVSAHRTWWLPTAGEVATGAGVCQGRAGNTQPGGRWNLPMLRALLRHARHRHEPYAVPAGSSKQQPAVPLQGLRRRKEVASARATLELLQEVAHVASKVGAQPAAASGTASEAWPPDRTWHSTAAAAHATDVHYATMAELPYPYLLGRSAGSCGADSAACCPPPCFAG